MSNRLSHSSVSRFQSCPKSYEYHYISKLRPKEQKAALLFGSAVDHAITSLFKEKGKDPYDIFGYFWRFQEVNGEDTYLPTSTDIVYANSDLDQDLLQEEDYVKLSEKFPNCNIKEEINKVIGEKEYSGFAALPFERKQLFNFVNWLCLYRKGMYMIKAVVEEVLPNIEEVLGVQEYVTLKNDSGDEVIGFADLVCKYKGYDKPIIFDFKTSTKEYEKDSVLTSPQLTLYVHALSEKFSRTRSAGFIVLYKQIIKNKAKRCASCGHDGTGLRHKTCPNDIEGKRCDGEWIVTMSPKCRTQIIIDDIPERTEDIVIENIDHINESIKNGIFHRNLQSCIMPWGKCPYYDLCYRDKADGLINHKEKK